MPRMRCASSIDLFARLFAVAVLAGCSHLAGSGAPPSPATPPASAALPLAPSAAPTFQVSDSALTSPLVFIAYGDMRFTSPEQTGASDPAARQALIAKAASLQPSAIFLNGDLPWHGVAEDYAVYRDETRAWRQQNLRIYPALGNHEFSRCAESACLEQWWSAFPELRGRRWYSVALGSRVLAVMLDSTSSLLPGSEQRAWLEAQLSGAGPKVRLIVLVLHHPPVADEQSRGLVDHNPRPNEKALADYLDVFAARARARIIVSAGHIHNYERFDRGGVVYLVSGGGGAHPYEVERTAADRYQSTDFPNYHLVRFEMRGRSVVGEMYRLDTTSGGAPNAAPGADGRAGEWRVRDRFELSLPP